MQTCLNGGCGGGSTGDRKVSMMVLEEVSVVVAIICQGSKFSDDGAGDPRDD